MEEQNKTKKICLIKFHGNFLKEAGPMASGKTRLTFDVPELFDHELAGIRQILREKNLIVYIFENDLAKSD